MRIGLLVRNETIKATRRVGAWATFLAFGGILSIIVGESYYTGLKHPERMTALPDAWSEVLGNIGPLPAIFASVALILLITSEFTWKTARQNVIDGLSKNEFFASKLILYPLVGMAFLGLGVVMAGLLGVLGTDFAARTDPLIRMVDLAHMGGIAVTVLGYTSIAFLSAFVARSSGPAMGVFFLYVAFLEQLAGSLIARLGETAAEVVQFLPRATFDSFFSRRQFDMAARQEAIDAAVNAGREIPTWHDTGLLLTLAAAWVATLLAVAYWSYRKRDL